MYALTGFISYCWVTILLVTVSMYIDNDVMVNVMHPLEGIWEKVEILSKKPNLVTSADFEKHAGILSQAQGGKKGGNVKNEI